MAIVLNAGLDELLNIIHEPHPSLAHASTEDVLVYLTIVANALLEGWYTSLEELAQRNITFSDPELVDEILALFRATPATCGIMKKAVLVNHQWVVKLGSNALLEAKKYNDACGDYLNKLVPTVPLGDFGCLQLKVELPMNSYGWGFDDPNIDRQYDTMTRDNNDVHRGNVGIWKGRLLHLDFAEG